MECVGVPFSKPRRNIRRMTSKTKSLWSSGSKVDSEIWRRTEAKTSLSKMSSRIGSLIKACRPGWSLPREFYFDEEIYSADLDAIWRRGWLFAGHSCEIPNP